MSWLRKKSQTANYNENQNCSSDNESSYNSDSDVNMSSKSGEESSSRDETEVVSSFSGGSKSKFHGMRVFDTIPPSHINSYFLVEIDEKKKYIHKQIACWLLTDKKTGLSVDRPRRVQQLSR